jgi:hypothetical protein
LTSAPELVDWVSITVVRLRHQRFSNPDQFEIPVLALAGGASPPWAASTTAMLAGSLPHPSERIVDGQQHIPADPVIAAILESFFR